MIFMQTYKKLTICGPRSCCSQHCERFPGSTLSTTTYSPPPSWMTSASGHVTSGNESYSFETPPSVVSESSGSGKRRIPITPRPKLVILRKKKLFCSHIFHSKLCRPKYGAARAYFSFIYCDRVYFSSNTLAIRNLMGSNQEECIARRQITFKNSDL